MPIWRHFDTPIEFKPFLLKERKRQRKKAELFQTDNYHKATFLSENFGISKRIAEVVFST